MRHRRVVAACASVLLVAGCSGGESEYDYAIPSEVCDVAVAQQDVKPLLPPGKSVKEDSSESLSRPGERKSCSIVVDEGVDLTVSLSRQWGDLDIVEEAADKYIGLKRVDLGGGFTSAGVGDDGAVAWAACKPKANQRQYEFPETQSGRYDALALEIRVGNEKPADVGEWRERIENFLRAYVPGMVQAWCA
ncbi:hypothetical protein GCM10010393_12610 [Streptomyces gobitricini]|uniref:DUF3558 domain-containing protein n=2 Tax=Streptomyces gobitricini TaxID=68211 RepID=A0ABN3LI60_9ACTN